MGAVGGRCVCVCIGAGTAPRGHRPSAGTRGAYPPLALGRDSGEPHFAPAVGAASMRGSARETVDRTTRASARDEEGVIQAWRGNGGMTVWCEAVRSVTV